jgi:hypothetical protein
MSWKQKLVGLASELKPIVEAAIETRMKQVPYSLLPDRRLTSYQNPKIYDIKLKHVNL